MATDPDRRADMMATPGMAVRGPDAMVGRA